MRAPPVPHKGSAGPGGAGELPTRRQQTESFTLAKLLVFLLFAGGPAISACACSLPVFRFALDRWPADTFRLLVAEQEAKEPTVSKFLRNFGADSVLNLEIHRTTEGPSRLLRPPHGDAAETTVWQGKVEERWLQSLGESPAATELVRRLLAGDSAVRVLVESGNLPLDETAAAALESPSTSPSPAPGPETVRVEPAATQPNPQSPGSPPFPFAILVPPLAALLLTLVSRRKSKKPLEK